jgi:hypothetical protein
MNNGWMALSGAGEDFFPIKLKTDWLSSHPGKESGTEFVGKEIDLTAEGSTNIGFENPDLAGGEADGFGKNKTFVEDAHAREVHIELTGGVKKSERCMGF